MPEVMTWYNPTTGRMEDADAPMSEVQAVEMLSGHPNSGEFKPDPRIMVRKSVLSGVTEQRKKLLSYELQLGIPQEKTASPKGTASARAARGARRSSTCSEA